MGLQSMPETYCDILVQTSKQFRQHVFILTSSAKLIIEAVQLLHGSFSVCQAGIGAA